MVLVVLTVHYPPTLFDLQRNFSYLEVGAFNLIMIRCILGLFSRE